MPGGDGLALSALTMDGVEAKCSHIPLKTPCVAALTAAMDLRPYLAYWLYPRMSWVSCLSVSPWILSLAGRDGRTRTSDHPNASKYHPPNIVKNIEIQIMKFDVLGSFKAILGVWEYRNRVWHDLFTPTAICWRSWELQRVFLNSFFLGVYFWI